MKKIVLVALLSDLPVIAIAITSQPENLDACVRQIATGTELSQLPHCSASERPESVLKNGSFPSTQIVGSSIAVANSTSESTVVNTIPRMSASATSHGQGEAHAYILSSRPLGNLLGTRTGAYCQNISHTSVHTFHVGYQNRISRNSTNVTRSVRWATGENTGQGTATVIATGSNKSATSGLVTDQGQPVGRIKANDWRSGDTCLAFTNRGRKDFPFHIWNRATPFTHAQNQAPHQYTLHQSNGPKPPP